jgi:four helix bundle protein
VYQLSYALALEVFEISRSFPREEQYSLTDQIRRCSRSVPVNIAEAWRRRKDKKAFVSKLVDSSSEEAEMEVWLGMCRDCRYITTETYEGFMVKYEEVGKMLNSMIDHPEKFCR